MSGSHYAPEPGRDDRYDCRTAEQRHEDAAQLALRIDNLVDALAYANKRIDDMTRAAMSDLGGHGHRLAALEDEVAALKGHAKAADMAIERIADAVQVLLFQRDDGK